MPRYAREAAPLAVAAILVPGALLLSTPLTSSYASRVAVGVAEEGADEVGSASTLVPSAGAAASSAPDTPQASSTPSASDAGADSSITPNAPVQQASPTMTDHSPLRAAVAAAAAFTALALGSALARVTTRWP
jgi:hypothetical protein